MKRSAMPTIQVYTTKHLFSRVMEWLNEIKRSEGDLKRVLDAPAGGGALTQALAEEFGLATTAIEIDVQKWRYERVSPLIADLSRPLPLESSYFDLVVCLEGLKHFTDVSNAIHEFSRVLRPGGLMLVTIPNDLCMQSRFCYLFDGWVDTDWIEPMPLNSQNERDHFHLNSLVSLPYLYYHLEKHGFQIIKTGADRYRFWSVIFALVLYPILAFVTWKRIPKEHPLRKEMLSFVWLSGRRNLILCRKLG